MAMANTPHASPKGTSYTYSIALAASGLLFVNSEHYPFPSPRHVLGPLLSIWIAFTLYHEGGYAGGAGFVWGRLAADMGCVGRRSSHWPRLGTNGEGVSARVTGEESPSTVEVYQSQ